MVNDLIYAENPVENFILFPFTKLLFLRLIFRVTCSVSEKNVLACVVFPKEPHSTVGGDFKLVFYLQGQILRRGYINVRMKTSHKNEIR